MIFKSLFKITILCQFLYLNCNGVNDQNYSTVVLSCLQDGNVAFGEEDMEIYGNDETDNDSSDGNGSCDAGIEVENGEEIGKSGKGAKGKESRKGT